MGVKNTLAEKERKVQESTQSLIANLNHAEQQHNAASHELEMSHHYLLKEYKFKLLHEEKCKALQEKTQQSVSLLVLYDKAIKQRMESNLGLARVGRREAERMKEMKVLREEKPKLTAMLKELQTNLTTLNTKEEALMKAADPYKAFVSQDIKETD